MHRFYGVAPHVSGDWLQVPARLFWAYAKELDQLEARESVGRINELAYAFGSMKQEEGRNYINYLQRRAMGNQAPVAKRPTSMAEIARLSGGLSRIVTTP